ncbi:MAG: ribonuclease III [Candidatus Nomurabacteria bacterium]|jgi:ribonuclease-3|nr:ribonuclease III [Candidatus Nomurabacteria bacterium]
MSEVVKKMTVEIGPEVAERYKKFAKEKVGYEFKDLGLLLVAMTHRSYVNEHRASGWRHNERLEFLGDAVLEMAVTDYLFKNTSDAEGKLTAYRAALVKTDSIADAGAALGFAEYLRVSKGERQHNGPRAMRVFIADAFEAVIGAIYMDGGYAPAAEFIYRNIVPKYEKIMEQGSWYDPKSHLQEWSQGKMGQQPKYRVLDESGPDHDKWFRVAVTVDGKRVGVGEASSKQEAERQAAKKALMSLKVK